MTLSDPGQYVAALAEMRDAAQQRAFISEATIPPSQSLIELLCDKIRELLPRDLSLAETLSESSLYLASILASPVSQAFAMRARAQVLYTMRRCAEAAPLYDKAAGLFEQAGLEGEFGRTLVAQIDNFNYLSQYDEAILLGDRARIALENAHDSHYLTTLEIALGNIFYRLDRFPESLAHYDRASDGLENTSNNLSIAAVGLNRAHVLTELNRFDEAMRSFEKTKEHCERHHMTLWAAIADRGISHMNFQRGNYSTALRILEVVRGKHQELADARRVGLCDLDRAEIYLQLNLFDDASRLARRAFQTFSELGGQYEAAKCLVFKGIVEYKLLNDGEAEKSFVGGGEMFLKEGNHLWVAIVDLWRAQLLVRRKEFAAGQKLAQQCAEAFEEQQAPVLAANAWVLSAQSWQELNNTTLAIAEARKALDEISGFHAPLVSYQCYNALGRLNELDGAFDQAEQLYLKAVSEMESLRGNITLDEMRISFGRDKYQVYENIVNLKLRKGDKQAAFEFVERSKSRTLTDLLERNLETVWDAGTEQSPRLQRIRTIREELNIFYNRLNAAGATARATLADTATKPEIEKREHELLELLRQAGSERSGWVTLKTMEPPGVDIVQKMLEPDEVLIEYYLIGEQFQAFIVSRDDFRVVRNLTTASAVRTCLKGFNFQLSKFHLQPAYVQARADQLLQAMNYHLRELYRQLIEPIQLQTRPRLLTIVPHHVLHYVPFHALYNGSRYIVDEHEVVYAASASVLRICRDRKVHKTDEDLILAVSDDSTPYIDEEVEALRRLLPKGRVFVGKEATVDKLRQYGPGAGKLHIAAHGIFRADNPMFSSLRLGDAWLDLFDIFNLQLGAELTTLSACETGMSAVWEGDELLGLARGFLYAGTPSLVVSLWTVNDRSTAQLMQLFYLGLQQGLSKAAALRKAIIEVKERFPHPYFWAPFVLMGKS